MQRAHRPATLPAITLVIIKKTPKTLKAMLITHAIRSQPIKLP